MTRSVRSRRRFDRTRWIVWALCPLLVPLPLSAEVNTTPLSLRYEAPERCGGERTLRERLRARSEALRFDSNEGATHVEVRIAEHASGVQAFVEVDHRGEVTRRSLEGANCEEVLDAVALIVVVTLEQRGALPTAANPSEPPTPAVPREQATEPKEPARREAESPTVDAGSTTTSAVPPDDTGESPWFPWPEQGQVGVGGSVQRGPAPNWLLGPELWLGFTWNPQAIGSVSLRLRVRRGGSGEVRRTEGASEFVLDTLGAELCPVRWGGTFGELRPCGEFEWGRMTARGFDTLDPERAERPWAAAGASVWGGVFVTEWLQLTARGGVAAPLIRDSFQFEPVVFYRVPALTLGSSIGLAVVFP